MMRRKIKENGSAIHSWDDYIHLDDHLRELCRFSRHDRSLPS